MSAPAESTLGLGSAVGRYLVLERLGAGAMGVVYAAYDPRLERKVAIKVLNASRSGGEDVTARRTRLLREAQAMARLSHPNVLAVFDAGEHEGEVYVIMELVAGETLRSWLQRPRAPREVLDAFLGCGRGLAAAHGAGLVHRDFKPDNVHVDDRGRVRVMDFGLARPTGVTGVEAPGQLPPSPELLEALTRTGEVAGTPFYMAPEQFLGLGADARTDQFAFSVALFEALYGVRPYAGDNLEQLAAAVTMGRLHPATSAQVPAWLARVIRRGLATRPDDRFPSMDALLAELERGSSARQRRVRKVGAAVAVTAAVALGATWLALRPGVCEPTGTELAGAWDETQRGAVWTAFASSGHLQAAEAFAAVTRVLDGWTQDWLAQRRDACEATHVRRDQSSHLFDLRMKCLSRRKGQLAEVSRLLATAGDSALVSRAVTMASALTPPRVCADVEALGAVVQPPDDPALRARVAQVQQQLDTAEALSSAGQDDWAQGLAVDAARRAAGTAYAPLRGAAHYLAGQLEARRGNAALAEAHLQQAITFAAEGHDDRLLARSWAYLLRETFEAGRRSEVWLLRPAAEAAAARAGDLESRANLTEVLGRALRADGKASESLAQLELALSWREEALGRDDPGVASIENELGSTFHALGRSAEALPHYTRALALREAAHGPRSYEVAAVLVNLGLVMQALGRLDEARDIGERALTIFEEQFGVDNARAAFAHNNLGIVLQESGDLPAARHHYQRAAEIFTLAYGDMHPLVALALGNVGEALLLQRDFAVSLSYYRRALAVAERAIDRESPDLAYPLTGIGACLVGLGRPAEAVVPLGRALALREAAEVTPIDLAFTRFTLARALAATGADRERTRRLATVARVAYAQAGEGQAKKVAEIDAWLAGREGG
jgi:tetratricopeptide (TPR) repeat protein